MRATRRIGRMNAMMDKLILIAGEHHPGTIQLPPAGSMWSRLMDIGLRWETIRDRFAQTSKIS